MVTYFSKKKNSPVIHPLITCGSVKSLPNCTWGLIHYDDYIIPGNLRPISKQNVRQNF